MRPADPPPRGLLMTKPKPNEAITPTRRWLWLGLASLLALGAIGLGLAGSHVASEGSPMADDQAAPDPSPIDGDRAYGYLKQICAIGPRPAGSAANTRQRELVARHFEAMGAVVREQKFTGQDPRSKKTVSMVNLIGSWSPDRVERVVVGVHYDTRPYPDRETDTARMNAPFVGANDGASGVALLMELAHHLKESATPWGVDLVLFDGEELVYGRNADIEDYFLGSKAFARAYKASRRDGKTRSRYVAGFVLDMVGDRDLDLPQEGYSVKLAPRLVREVWSIAKKLDAKAFRAEVGTEVYDDHLPMNDAGIPTIDLIDFDYPEWHKAGDLPDQCSAASLEQVGRVVSAWLNQPKPKGTTKKK
jgi:glutaminyl-peptide cyclotransferase